MDIISNFAIKLRGYLQTLMTFLRWLLAPVMPIYWLVSWLRNKLYDLHVFKSKTYNMPIICVGNLSTGGTGKTPMVEYLLNLLKDRYQLATLSRGYKRRTSGFVLASESSDAASLGDEPFQIHQKFPAVEVAVDANRQNGIEQLKSLTSPEIIILDDAFQHRKVEAGFSILLTAYDNLYTDDFPLPTGDLREPRSGARRADAIVVTKCPPNVEVEKEAILKKISPLSHQKVFFSSIDYSETFHSSTGAVSYQQLKDHYFTLVTGIANPKPLVGFLKKQGFKFEHLKFPDHHHFSEEDINRFNQKKLILTTEKDWVRLEGRLAKTVKLFYLPIEIRIDDATAFDDMVNAFVNDYLPN